MLKAPMEEEYQIRPSEMEDLDRIMPEIFYHTPYPQEDLALTVYEKAGVMGGVLLHVTHKGVADVAF